MKESLKTLLRLLCLFAILSINSCKKSSDDSPAPPPPDDDTEMVPDIYLMVFNASQEAGAIDIVVESTLLHLDLAPSKNTNYQHFDQGNVLVTIRQADGNATLLTKQLELEGGSLYSSYFYQNKEGEYDLLVSEDFDDVRRIAPGSSRTVKFKAVHLSKNISFESIDIYNIEANRSTPGGDVGISNRVWINDLSYGNIQLNETAGFGSVANHVQFASGTSQVTSIPDGHEIEFDNLPAIPLRTNEGSNGGGPTITVFNTRPFESNISYVFIAYDHGVRQGDPDGKIIVLNNIRVIE